MTGNQTHANWVEFIPDPRLSKPECVESLWSRDNHLGNGNGGFPNYFNWTIPDIPHERCVFRARYKTQASKHLNQNFLCELYNYIFVLRYNITSGEYDGFNSSINSSIMKVQEKIFNPQTNTVSLTKRISQLDVYSKFGFNYEEAKSVSFQCKSVLELKIEHCLPPIREAMYSEPTLL